MPDDLFSKAAPEPEQVAQVIRLIPDGIYIREEDGSYWVGRRRGSHALCEVSYTRDELVELHERLFNVLR